MNRVAKLVEDAYGKTLSQIYSPGTTGRLRRSCRLVVGTPAPLIDAYVIVHPSCTV
jgi:hypothetical protein